jgi:hypothetical protein
MTKKTTFYAAFGSIIALMAAVAFAGGAAGSGCPYLQGMEGQRSASDCPHLSGSAGMQANGAECPYLAGKSAAGDCPYAGQGAAGECPYLSGAAPKASAGGECPMTGGVEKRTNEPGCPYLDGKVAPKAGSESEADALEKAPREV